MIFSSPPRKTRSSEDCQASHIHINVHAVLPQDRNRFFRPCLLGSHCTVFVGRLSSTMCSRAWAVVRQRDVLYTSQGHIDVRECESERHHLTRMWSGLGTARRKFEEFQRGTQKQLCNWTVHDAVLRTDPEAFLLRIATVSSGLYQASVEMVLESVRSEPLFSYIRKQCRGKWLPTRGLASDIDCQHNVVRRKITQHVIFCTSSHYLTSRDMILHFTRPHHIFSTTLDDMTLQYHSKQQSNHSERQPLKLVAD